MKTEPRFILILFAFIVKTAFCQTIDKLDEKNGFKTFKLGDNKTKYEGKLKFWKFLTENNESVYFYTGKESELFTVFDLKVDSVKLFFDDSDKLVCISLLKKYHSNGRDEVQVHYQNAIADINILFDKFTAMFGKPSGMVNEQRDTYDSVGLTWTSNNVILKVITIGYSITVGSDNEVMVYKKSFLQKKFNSGF